MTKALTCISCPIGCSLTATVAPDGEITVSGNLCKRGVEYAVAECRSPTRMLATTVRLQGGENPAMVPVKSAAPVPKDKVLDCVKALRSLTVTAPLGIGDIILENVCGVGVDIICCREIEAPSAADAADAHIA